MKTNLFKGDNYKRGALIGSPKTIVIQAIYIEPILSDLLYWVSYHT